MAHARPMPRNSKSTEAVGECKAREPGLWSLPSQNWNYLQYSPFLRLHVRLLPMSVFALFLCFAALTLAMVIGFFAGRFAGARGAETVRAQERLDTERSRAEGAQALALLRAEAAANNRDRDRAVGELSIARDELSAAARQLAVVREALAAAEADGRARLESLRDKEAQLLRAGDSFAALQAELRETAATLEGARKQNEVEATESEKKLALLAGAEEKLGNQFKVLASEIFREKSRVFREESEASLGSLLTPLRERMGEFQQRVEALQREGVVGRTELREQLGNLKTLNEQLSSEASNLARALKGSTKTQGDWGEVLLGRMLDAAGLRAGKEYRVQQSFSTEEGRQARPDIILDLPGDKHLVIDSKVSLNSYTEYCGCEDEPTRKRHVERHARALRDHVDGLSKKSYQALHGLRSVDFVVMFVPIEPAYLLAIAHDEELWQRAWQRDVLLVSPGTLFPVIRTIAHIWKQEKQTRNVEEIVRQAGALYDKVALFADTFVDVGKRLDGAKSAYDKAWGQLRSGNGDVLSRIERMRQLGLPTNKKMPPALASDEEGVLEPLFREEQASGNGRSAIS